MSSIKKNLGWLVVLLALLSLAACKIDMEQEIWLNKNNSGRAAIRLALNIPMGYDAETMDSTDLGQENAMAELAERANSTKGVVVTKYDKTTAHTDEEMNFIYYLDFTFKDLDGLRSVLCIDPNSGITLEKTRKGKMLTIDARQLYLQVEGSDEEAKYCAIDALRLIGDPRAEKAIKKCLSDRASNVRYAAAFYCGSRKVRNTASSLINLLSDPNEKIRLISVWALGQIPENECISQLASLYTHEKDKNVRNEIMRVLTKKNITICRTSSYLGSVMLSMNYPFLIIC